MAQSSESPKKKALVLLIDKNEDVEVAITTYCFRLAGVETILAGVEGTDPVECIKGLKFVPDMSLAEAAKKGPYDIILLPGGIIGGDNMADNPLVGEVLREQESRGGLIGAICCGSAYTLTGHGIYKGRKITTDPKDIIVQRVLDTRTHVLLGDEPVVVDGPLITGMGPAICFSFALRAIRELCGAEAEDVVKKYILWDRLKI